MFLSVAPVVGLNHELGHKRFVTSIQQNGEGVTVISHDERIVNTLLLKAVVLSTFGTQPLMVGGTTLDHLRERSRGTSYPLLQALHHCVGGSALDHFSERL